MLPSATRWLNQCNRHKSNRQFNRRSYRSMYRRLWAPSLGLSLAWMSLAGSARASDTFPSEVKDELGLQCAPTCLLCHGSQEGGADNMSAYGAYLKSQGFPARPIAQATQMDFDTDGVSDMEELLANHDPAVFGPGDQICSSETYGCGASIAPAAAAERPAGGAWWVGLGVVMVLWARKRRPLS